MDSSVKAQGFHPSPDGNSQSLQCPVCGGKDAALFCNVLNGGEQWQIRQCKTCLFGWTRPVPPADRIASYYPPTYLGDTGRALDEFYSGELQRSRSWRGELEKARLVQGYIKTGKILDVGCGDGKFLWALDPENWDRTGVERSGETLAIVRARMPELRLIAGDIHSLALSRSVFDVITFWHVLEHLPDPEGALRRAAALLRPDGWVFISLPNIASYQARLFRKFWYPFDDVPRHLHHFSRQSLNSLLSKAGLQARKYLPFSRRINFHSLKHSLIHWSEARFGGRGPYYALKPLLFVFQLLDRTTGNAGIITVIAQKPMLDFQVRNAEHGTERR